jgi:hypothetical protein
MLKKLFLTTCLLIHLEIQPMYCRTICRKAIVKSNPNLKEQLNKNLLEAVKNHSYKDCSQFLSQGADPNSFRGHEGILSCAIYSVNCSVCGSGKQEHIDESLQMLQKLLEAGIDTTPTKDYNCVDHVELIASNSRHEIQLREVFRVLTSRISIRRNF